MKIFSYQSLNDGNMECMYIFLGKVVKYCFFHSADIISLVLNWYMK